jgi:hypothetical protein
MAPIDLTHGSIGDPATSLVMWALPLFRRAIRNCFMRMLFVQLVLLTD